MRKITYIGFISSFILILSSDVNAKSLIPGLSRIKAKVENALNAPKAALKDILTKTKNLGSKIIINGKNVNEIDAENERKKFESEINGFEADLNALYWCKQDKFAEQLKMAQDKSTILKDKFKEKYKNVKSSLMTFAKELSDENDKINEIQDKMRKNAGTIKKYSNLASKYQTLADMTIKYCATLNGIIIAMDNV